MVLRSASGCLVGKAKYLWADLRHATFVLLKRDARVRNQAAGHRDSVSIVEMRIFVGW